MTRCSRDVHTKSEDHRGARVPLSSSLLGSVRTYDHRNVPAAEPVLHIYLEKISDQAIVSHLENGSLWVLVDGNNSLNEKKQNDKLNKLNSENMF